MTNQDLADVIRPGTGRGLDFVVIDELRKRTGIIPISIPRWTVSEMVSNSLDTDATTIHITAEEKDGYDVYSVTDNGTKRITEQDIKLILDFANKASSKRGVKRVSRGYLGNALKCIFGYSYALNEKQKNKIPDIHILSHGTLFTIALKPTM